RVVSLIAASGDVVVDLASQPLLRGRPRLTVRLLVAGRRSAVLQLVHDLLERRVGVAVAIADVADRGVALDRLAAQSARCWLGVRRVLTHRCPLTFTAGRSHSAACSKPSRSPLIPT